MGLSALADTALVGGGEAAVADAALTEAAGATTLVDGSVLTAGGTILPAAGAVDAATGILSSTGNTVLSSATSPTGFIDGVTGEAVNADGTAFTQTANLSANQVSALQPTTGTDYSFNSAPGSSPVGQMSMSSLTNSLSPNYVPQGLQVSGAVSPATDLLGNATMGGAQGLTTDLSALPSVDSMDEGVAQGTGTLSQSGVTSSISNPITDPAPTSSLSKLESFGKQAATNLAMKAIGKGVAGFGPTIPGNTYVPPTNTASNNVGSYNTASSPLSITPLFTGNPSSNGMFLSPLNTAGLSADQINSLYTPSGLGDTTTPNLLAASAVPSGGIFPVQQRYSGFKEGGSTHKPEFMTGVTGHYAQGRGTGQSDDIPALLKDGDYVMDADIVAALGDGSNKAGAEALHHFMHQFPHKHYENHSEGGHINAMIADGEFVFPASLVTALGGGSNKEGAKKLDEMREKIREHKRSASANKIPPKAKSPLSYMEGK